MAGVEGTIVAAMGIHNIKNYEGSQREIILCADNDGPNASTHSLIQQTGKTFRSAGKSITIIQPRHEEQDFNDVLKNEGTQAVETYLTPYRSFESEKSQTEHTPKTRRKSSAADT